MTLSRPNSGFCLAGSSANTSSAAPATWPESSAALRSASTTSPPRAQLMMRTPFFVLASALASIRLRVASVSGVCRVMKSARASSSSSVDLLDAEVAGALVREEGIEGDHLHLQAEGAVGDDRADIAAADDAERLAGELDAHEARLLPLAGLGRAVGGGDLAGQREHHGDGVLGGGDGVAVRRVHHHDAALGGRGDVDVVDADAGAADDLEVRRGGQDLAPSPWSPSARRARHSRRWRP